MPTMVARDDALRTLENEVTVLIRRVKRVIAHRARMLHPDLQGASYVLLSYLEENGPVRASEIAEELSIDKGAVSRQVSHLLDLGLVERHDDPDDRRATLLSLSGSARDRLCEIKATRRHVIDQRLGEWPTDELEQFVSGLTRYNAALESI